MSADFDVFVEFSEASKHDKRHAESSGNNPGTRLSGKRACVLLTADERTTGVCHYIDFSDCSLKFLMLFSHYFCPLADVFCNWYGDSVG